MSGPAESCKTRLLEQVDLRGIEQHFRRRTSALDSPFKRKGILPSATERRVAVLHSRTSSGLVEPGGNAERSSLVLSKHGQSVNRTRPFLSRFHIVEGHTASQNQFPERLRQRSVRVLRMPRRGLPPDSFRTCHPGNSPGRRRLPGPT